jgi:hypothetical protein
MKGRSITCLGGIPGDEWAPERRLEQGCGRLGADDWPEQRQQL